MSKTKMMSFRIPVEEYDKMRVNCARLGIDMTTYIRSLNIAAFDGFTKYESMIKIHSDKINRKKLHIY